MTDLTSPLPPPDDAAGDAECRTVVRAAIVQCVSTLSPTQRRALPWVLAGLTRGEIAEKLNITPNFAGVTTHGVRHRLRDCLHHRADANQKLAACLSQMSGYGTV